jgi:phytoene dehydrogenase-like protein
VRGTRRKTQFDVVVVGSGPNGLAAANALARAGLSTLVVEREATFGGGCRSQELTLPGFTHDVCSTVHPLGCASPFFHSLELERYGLRWVQPPAALAHVLEDGSAVTLERSIEHTAAQLGDDADAYRRLVAPFTERFEQLGGMILGPLRLPSHPLLLARFGLSAFRSMDGLARGFRDERTRALLAGIAAHAMIPLEDAPTAAFGLVLAIAGHYVGWPVAQGGSQAIADALIDALRARGGELQAERPVESLDELPSARAYVLDVTPRQLLAIAGARLPAGYRERLQRFRYGAGVFKMDFALSGPIPWQDPACMRAATVHLSGSLADIARAEAAVHQGKLAEKPFVLLVQPTLFDAARAPSGQHIAWAYCHVPHGSELDASAQIEAQIERAAPGFRELVLARSSRNAREVEQYNPNYVGGDINGGMSDLGQLFFRPMLRLDPYATPAPDVFLCSSSTPPGGGVHGMCGYFAARSVLRRAFGFKRVPESLMAQTVAQRS